MKVENITAITLGHGEAIGFAYVETDGDGYRGYFKSDIKKDGTPDRRARGIFIRHYLNDQLSRGGYLVAKPEREAAAAPIRAEMRRLEAKLSDKWAQLRAIYLRPEEAEQ